MKVTTDKLALINFERAVVKGKRQQRLKWLMRKENDLISLNEMLACLPVNHKLDRGLTIVPVDQIVGSEGRHLDFDRGFLPRQSHTRSRWMSIDKAYLQNVNLPPVELVKIDQVYFVRDGNHRVSVAKSRVEPAKHV